MSYNIMGKNASFKGDISGTIENQVNDWDNQSISGSKSFAATISSSADVMLSGSGKVSASFFYGDGSGLSGVAAAAGADREVQFNNGGSALGAVSNFTFNSSAQAVANKLSVNGQISASFGITGSEFHGDGSNLTAVTASFVTASNVVGILNASQINIGDGLEANSNAIQINLSGSTSGLSIDSDGLQIDMSGLGPDASYSNSKLLIVQEGTNPPKRMSFSTLESNMSIAAPNLTGEINNDRLPDTISVPKLSGSTHISGAFFFGNGAALTGVTSTPTPAGSNTQIQFNDDGAIAADADLTFLTGSNTLATSNLSASVNISGSSLYLQDEIIVGGQAFLDINANVAANNASFVEITASSTISSSADVYGANFRGNGSTLNNVPMSNYASNRIIFAGSSTNTLDANSALNWDGNQINTIGLSASADLQVGGHITGSGDIVLGGTMYWDRTGTGDTTGPKLTPGGSPANSLNIDGDSIITFQADTNARFRVGNASTPDLILDITPTVVSSSVPITGSALHTNGGITMPGGGGDFTFLSDQGNVTAGSIEMVAGGSDVLNFNDNSISGSGNISGSAFYGDGSNLQNVQATPQFRYAYFTNNSNITTSARFVDWLGPSNQASLANMRGGIIIAPTSGSVVRISFTPTDNVNTRSDGDDMIVGITRNVVNTLSTAVTQGKQLLAATGSFDKAISFYDDANGTTNTFTGEIDFVNGTRVTGSNSFDPGDILGFAFRTPDGTTNLCGITLVLKFEES